MSTALLKATVTVLRTSDSQKREIEVPLSSSLNNLKDQISSSEWGPICRDHQRLFHLGRELKSGRKSLTSLGVGKFDNFLLHLHSTQPKTIDLASDEAVVVTNVGRSNSAGETKRDNTVIDLVDDGDAEEDEDVQIIDNAHTRSYSKRRRR